MEQQSFVFFVSLCAATHIVRTTYEILKHKKKLQPSRISFVIIFTNMAVLWMSWIMLCSKDIYTIELPKAVHYVGLLLCIVGLIFFLTALFTIKTLETYSGDLITKGIYSKVRHPMYFGFILWLVGFPIYFGGMVSSVFGLVFIGNILFWRNLEEIELDHRFSGYKTYKAKTFF